MEKHPQFNTMKDGEFLTQNDLFYDIRGFVQIVNHENYKKTFIHFMSVSEENDFIC